MWNCVRDLKARLVEGTMRYRIELTTSRSMGKDARAVKLVSANRPSYICQAEVSDAMTEHIISTMGDEDMDRRCTVVLQRTGCKHHSFTRINHVVNQYGDLSSL